MELPSPREHREISGSEFGNNTRIHQGNNNVYNYGMVPHRARAGVVHVIPYPRNEDLVRRQDLVDTLYKLLPLTPGSRSAALWGLGGSGKTQIALEYAYRRCDTDKNCCVFWVHADTEATFLADYKTIGRKLGVNKELDGHELLAAVRDEIESRPKWAMILDNADDLRLFGVRPKKEDGPNEDRSLRDGIPCGPEGTVLWTSRDAHISGTLVGPSRGIEVRAMTMDEARTLFASVRNQPSASTEAGIDALLGELQCLPLAISQAGAYMRRMHKSAQEYLAVLEEGSSRWDVLKISDTDRHRRPGVSNSVLETWKISTDRIREENEMSYWILHILAYLDSRDIPFDLVERAARRYDGGENSYQQATELEVQEAVVRLQEFSFLSLLHGTQDGGQSYDMHQLVQETLRYGLRLEGAAMKKTPNLPGLESKPVEYDKGEGYFSEIALQIIDDIFPASEPLSRGTCEQYLTHAIRVGEWADVNSAGLRTANLLRRASVFLHDRGRWNEQESVEGRRWTLLRKMFGNKHPHTMHSMANLADAIAHQGRYLESENLMGEVIDLQRDVLGDKHRDTIWSMGSFASIYVFQGRYDEAEKLSTQVLDLRREALGDKHPDTLRSMGNLATTYHGQGRHDEAEKIRIKVLDLMREALGEKHPDTIRSTGNLAMTYYKQCRYYEAKILLQSALDLGRHVMGGGHPVTVWAARWLARTHQAQHNLPVLQTQDPVSLP